MEELVFYLQGQGAEINVYDNRVLIVRKESYRNIFFCNIKRIDIKPLIKGEGCMEFYIKTEEEVNLAQKETIKLKSARAKQENLMAYTIKAFIEQQIKKDLVKAKAISFLSAKGIKNFKELLDSEIITQEEFDAKKKQLLGL